MTNKAKKACDQWLEDHTPGSEWELVDGWFFQRAPMVVMHNTTGEGLWPENPTPWCVQYLGNGHYFKSEANAYKWALWRMTEKVEEPKQYT